MASDEIPDHMDVARTAIGNGVDAIVDRVLEDILLEGHKVELLTQLPTFIAVLAAGKVAQIKAHGGPVDRKAVMAAYWPMEKAMKADAPTMLMQVMDAAQAERRG